MKKSEQFPTGTQRKIGLIKNNLKIDTIIVASKNNQNEGGYAWSNSPLLDSDKIYETSFESSFRELLPAGEKNLKTYIEKILERPKEVKLLG